MTRTRWLAVALLLGGLVFAVQGGEYGTTHWLALRNRERDEHARVAELQGMVDSLERQAQRIERDPKVQERIAREQFGMIRNGEFLYRIVPADTSRR
jgi:cell division protein FtsB